MDPAQTQEVGPAGDPSKSPPQASVELAGPEVTIERGVCYALFAFDVGLAIDLDLAERQIVAVTQRETIRHKRRTPPYFQYEPAPIRVTQNCAELTVAGHQSAATLDAVIYDFGAISVAYRFPLSGALARLLALSDGLSDNQKLLEHSRGVVRELLTTIQPAVTKPHISDFVEDYAIYQIESVAPSGSLTSMVSQRAAELAQILRAERVTLSEQEVSDALACRISFGSDDVAILDWNATLLCDPDADDVRIVLEYANVELLELRYLDDQLDHALDRAYEAVSRRRWRWPLLFDPSRSNLRRIAELQMDNAYLFEGVNNALKLLGDQYLARVYRLAAQRLHLSDWDASILRKLQTLESMYEKVSNLTANARMELLEWIIIVLIALSILLELLP